MAPVIVTLPNGVTNAEVTNQVSSVAELKIWAASQCGLSPLQLGVFGSSGAALLDEESLATSGCDLLQVLPLLPGGKVHGSLARAGKVRGQTPKVAKQEKRKSKTGRAKRRNQYNKRFVATVNLPGGRRRGPNANS